MVTASGLRMRARVTPTFSVPSPPTCCIALLTSSEVMATASSAYSSSWWQPSAARIRQRATRTDSGMPGKTNAISRGSACAAALVMVTVLPCLRDSSLHG